MQVWDGETDSRITFDWSADTSPFENLPTVATMTENANLVRGLLSRIAASGDENISIFSNTTVSSIENGTDHPDGPDLSAWPVLSLAPNGTAQSQLPTRIAARLLVGADGINSPVRRFADIATEGWDYNRHGVVATLSLADPDQVSFPIGTRTAYQRFLPTGPIAMLPLPGNHSTLVWSTTPENAARLKSLSPEDFTALVNAGFRLGPVDLKYMHGLPSGQVDELNWRVQHTAFNPDIVPQPVTSVQEGTVASFPLRLQHADTYIGERVALVGDAAHTINPLAGQGLNLGQGDVQALVRAISVAVQHGQDIGTQMALEPYNSERYAVNHVMLGVCDKLHKLYSFGSGPLVPLRSVGLNAVNAMKPVKDFLIGQASGGGVRLF